MRDRIGEFACANSPHVPQINCGRKRLIWQKEVDFPGVCPVI